jgi:hypothetical protein
VSPAMLLIWESSSRSRSFHPILSNLSTLLM